MTDRVHSFTVVLAKDRRIDDAQAVMKAIRQFKGVISVTPNVSDIESHIATQRASFEIQEALFEMVSKIRDGTK